MPILYPRVHPSQSIANSAGSLRAPDVRGWWEHGTTKQPIRGKDLTMGRKPSDDYDPGEPGQWGEPYEMIDDVEGDEDDDD